ncbi:MAG: amidohydrolase family protein [Alphaproteobacteria bacterium]|nr:amidohydrolase family protein [Alphaproteobacteria bacterium]
MRHASVLLEGADLIDGSAGPVIRDATVLIEGERIKYAGPRKRFADERIERLDLSGKTLIPGLIEAHTHAAFDADMLAYVKNGITTIRFAGLDQNDVARLRQRVEHGELIGPRILSCGPMIDQPPPAYPEWSVAVSTPAEAAATAERLIARDNVEYLIVTQRVTVPVMAAVVRAAHAHGRTVVAQTWAVDGKEAAELGIDELHNSSRVYVSRDYPKKRLLNYESIADRLAMSGRAWATIDWDATRSIMAAMVDKGVPYCGMQVMGHFQQGIGVTELETDADFLTLFGKPERDAFFGFIKKLQGSWTPDDLEHWRVANENRMEWMRRFRALGGDLLVGTDMQFGGITLHQELRNIAALGVSPMEVIAMATSGNARALRINGKLGRIAEGLLADIVVLNRDPTNDLGALRDIACVFRDGAMAWSDPSRSWPARA